MDDIESIKSKFGDFQDILKRRSVQSWLLTCAHLDSERWGPERTDGVCPPFASAAVAHYALRLSPVHSWKSIPRLFEKAIFTDAADKYIASEYRPIERLNDPADDHRMYHAFAPMMYEQLTFDHIGSHLLARAEVLFSPYDSITDEKIGLTIREILAIASGVFVFSRGGATFTIGDMSFFLKDVCTQKSLERFLAYFSTNIIGYRAVCIAEGQREPHRYEFNYLSRFPIIKLAPSRYLAPLTYLVARSIIRRLDHSILNSIAGGRDRDDFLRNLGKTFEDYVTLLFANSGTEPISCESIPGIRGKKNEKRAEFYVNIDGLTVVVECKRFAFRRDTMAIGKSKDIDSEIAGKLAKGVEQIKNTIDKLAEQDCVGLLVTYDYVPLANSDHFPLNIPENTIVMSVDDLERLLAFEHEKIAPLLRRISLEPRGQRKEFGLELESLGTKEHQVHPYLDERFRLFARSVFQMDQASGE